MQFFRIFSFLIRMASRHWFKTPETCLLYRSGEGWVKATSAVRYLGHVRSEHPTCTQRSQYPEPSWRWGDPGILANDGPFPTWCPEARFPTAGWCPETNTVSPSLTPPKGNFFRKPLASSPPSPPSCAPQTPSSSAPFSDIAPSPFPRLTKFKDSQIHKPKRTSKTSPEHITHWAQWI